VVALLAANDDDDDPNTSQPLFAHDKLSKGRLLRIPPRMLEVSLKCMKKKEEEEEEEGAFACFDCLSFVSFTISSISVISRNTFLLISVSDRLSSKDILAAERQTFMPSV
jgi:hypothetical protein